ncbi:hypothetical protein [Chryseobacterium indoltheticum]|uniref:hypothetical protein n=1 Tax=Chryseobacterium indoltheticum TaxID=254 RepID=UPI0028EEAFA5|nr:hypothetical protein [Chryseobacterium indoltheticum]
MKKKLFGFAVIASCFVFGQDIKLKDDHVFIDKNKCMRYVSKELGSTNTFYSLNGEKLFYMDINQNKRGNQFYKIQFTGSDYVIKAVAPGMNVKKSFLTLMLEEGVISPKDCSVNFANIKNFADRYHDKSFDDTETTVIINNNSSETRPRNGFNISLGR